MPASLLVITVLCAVGFYASVFMFRKHLRSERGELKERSVVQSPRAKLFAGIPNSLIGLIYYPVLAMASWLQPAWLHVAALAAAALAAGTSAYLAYSLLFVTKRSCPYCFTSHAVNAGLLAATAWQVSHIA